MIKRIIENEIVSKLHQGKVILIFGPRQVGKTTLVRKIVNESNFPYLWMSGDEPDIREQFKNITSVQFKNIVGDANLIVIDEAQRIENIGLTLKLAVDNFPEKQIIATGSSAFELANKINEPLTGRKFEFHLYPFSYEEMVNSIGAIDEKRMLEHRLLYGSYPEVINKLGHEKATLNLLTDSYLYKDLLAFEGIKKSSLLQKILIALALQIGNEVSYNELSQIVGADKNTVEKYIDLLEQVFVIFKLHSLSRNIRNELKKSKKIYFYDNGIRNAIISNFQPLEIRNDKGALWENYLISERIKLVKYHNLYGNKYFWRTSQQQEIDYLEERDGRLEAFEFKWNSNTKVNFPKTFNNAYPNSLTQGINNDNYPSFLTNFL
jgi:uncharacterized protein